MKNTIYTIIMIALLAVATFLIISPNKSVAPADNGGDTSQTEEVITGSDEETSYQKSVDMERSEVTWVGKKSFVEGYEDKGTIALLSGGLNVPTEESEIGGEFVFDMNSIVVTETGVGGGFAGLEKDLKSENFFDILNHPTAKFVITGGNQTSIVGDLTIKGITKSVTVGVSSWNETEQFVEGSIAVNRLDFGMDFRSEGLIGRIENQVIADTFDINFKIYYK